MTELANGAAFFTLLDISERRLAHVRRQRYGVRLLRSAIVVLALAALLGSAIALLRVADSEPVPAGWLGASACAALAALATWIFTERPAGRRLSADEHGMIEDVRSASRPPSRSPPVLPC